MACEGNMNCRQERITPGGEKVFNNAYGGLFFYLWGFFHKSLQNSQGTGILKLGDVQAKAFFITWWLSSLSSYQTNGPEYLATSATKEMIFLLSTKVVHTRIFVWKRIHLDAFSSVSMHTGALYVLIQEHINLKMLSKVDPKDFAVQTYCFGMEG